jgi:protein-S-isoprenylcysteine O-methyltransferase Ste14
MAVLRALLTITWAAWIWLELVVVFGLTLLDRLRGRGARPDVTGGLVLLLAAAGGFGAAVLFSRLGAGVLPVPAVACLAAGLALMWPGLALRVWAVRRLRDLSRAAAPVPSDHRLVATGPYRHLRHPASAGALLAAAGFGLALGHWTSVLAAVAGWALGLAAGIRLEDGALRRALGPAYEDYASRTSRLIPRLY